MKHPAINYTYDELLDGLERGVSDGDINVRQSRDLRQYTYSKQCQYERNWNEFSIIARGIILDNAAKCLVALPFPKFFNYKELVGSGSDFVLPPGRFDTFEKMDGSLIIIYWHDGAWRCATKGSMSSDQAKWAKEWFDKHIDKEYLLAENTYLCEAIYPENRIVVRYTDQQTGLYFLGGYNRVTGEEISMGCGKDPGFKSIGWYSYNSIADVEARSLELSSNEEGFVVRFSNGLRVKFKGEEYCRLHRCLSNVTPLAVWELMAGCAQKEMSGVIEAFRKELPEEFWTDFDTIFGLLHNKMMEIVTQVNRLNLTMADKTDKEVGIWSQGLTGSSHSVGKFIFAARKNKLGWWWEGKGRAALFREIRPNGNKLEGYLASVGLLRVQEAEE